MFERNKKAISTLIMILLMIVSATIGGIVTYMFAIYPFVAIPNKTTLSITDVYFDKQNATSFNIAILNPSYSPSDANITGIAVKLAGESQVYNVVGTDPSLENGLIIPVGKTLNITCSKIEKDGFNSTWGEFAAQFAGEKITVLVLASDSSASDMEKTLPFVNLNVTNTIFNSQVSFKNFTITVANKDNSEVNLTISDITILGIDLTADNMSPQLPQAIAAGASIDFTFTNASWHTLRNTTAVISTKEGYTFSKALYLPGVATVIQSVAFDENSTSYFNATVFNFAESANYVNVTKITATMNNGTAIENTYDPSQGIEPNSTRTFRFDWDWKTYRGGTFSVVAELLQGFETDSFTARRPPLIMLKVLNATFDLQDTLHFNITVQNYQFSIEPVNITGIKVGGNNVTASVPTMPYGLVYPNQDVSFNCNLSWATLAGQNLNITISALTNESLENWYLPFPFTPPSAELNITSTSHTTAGFFDITVQSFNYSLMNVTISRVVYQIQNVSAPIGTDLFPSGYTVIKPGDLVTIQSRFNWQDYAGQSITVTVITDQGVQATWQETI
jgi:hypothetical protein